jgi:hypothetical protein
VAAIGMVVTVATHLQNLIIVLVIQHVIVWTLLQILGVM